MLMTSTSPELPTGAEPVEQTRLPAGRRYPEPNREPNRESREDPRTTFELRFSRCRRLLFFIANRILNCAQEAEEAVKNCRLTASCNPPAFPSDGAFKSWLVRILIDEATLLLRKRQAAPTASSKLPEGR
jgi:DNA-directed RNA polymerase specialized sigma24 family protein